MHLKMSSAEVVCCKLLPFITDELSKEANSLNPQQTAPSLIWVHTVCHRGFLNISADEKSRQLLLQLAHEGLLKNYLFFDKKPNKMRLVTLRYKKNCISCKQIGTVPSSIYCSSLSLWLLVFVATLSQKPRLEKGKLVQ